MATSDSNPVRSGDALAKAAALAERSPKAAMELLRPLLAADPGNGEARQILASTLRALGHLDWETRADRMIASLQAPQLVEAAKLLEENQIGRAERLLRPYLQQRPDDTSALRLMAQLATRVSRYEDAEKLLEHALSVDPAYGDARRELAVLFTTQSRLEDALAQIELLLNQQPESTDYLVLMATTLQRLGRNDEAVAHHEQALRIAPDSASLWIKYGTALRTVRRLDDSVAAYRRALELMPSAGVAWWSLSNLKTVRLSQADIAEMLLALSQDDLSAEDRLHLHFALGKATEDQGCAREAFTHYSEANRLRRQSLHYDPHATSRLVAANMNLFDRRFFSARSEYGSDAADPIFVLGMPRSGSTLVEQILASHPEVEGAAELHYMPNLAGRFGLAALSVANPRSLAELGQAEVWDLADDYMEKLAPHRQLGRVRIVDKYPNNWIHIGLIHLLFPKAGIIDVRRHPLACGWSNFKQHFAQGQGFSFSLEHIGLYYRDYVVLLRHFDEVLPGRVHRVIYERLVEDPEEEVRRLLDYLGLPFDERCMRFYDNDRAVRTPSSEQVRRPINRDGVDQWRPFEPWLGPMKEGMGAIVEAYPAVPQP